ncbi:MAG: glycogen debranching enzyme N-terminal domain-containing protein, partial [Gemmatimonadaceae bacterium]
MTTRRLIDRIVRELDLPPDAESRAAKLLDVEWLVTNGIGGYSSSTAAGVITRRYHGILVAALPNPLGRMVMLNHLGERLRAGGRSVALSSETRVAGPVDPSAAVQVTSFRLESGLPVWEYAWGDLRVEKRVIMPHRQNTVHISYRLVAGADTAALDLRPAVHFRGYEDRVDALINSPSTTPYTSSATGGLHVLHLGTPSNVPSLKLR